MPYFRVTTERRPSSILPDTNVTGYVLERFDGEYGIQALEEMRNDSLYFGTSENEAMKVIAVQRALCLVQMYLRDAEANPALKQQSFDRYRTLAQAMDAEAAFLALLHQL